MIQSTAPFISLIPIEMAVSTSIFKKASLPPGMRNLAARIVTVTLLPFLMIAAFEAVVVNGSKTLANVVIYSINTLHACFFPKSQIIQEILPPIAAPRQEEIDEPLEMAPAIELPHTAIHDREKMEWVVETLGTNDPISVLTNNHVSSLNASRGELEHLHPFQVLDVVFGKYSTVKKHVHSLMNQSMFRSGFLGGFEEGLTNPKFPQHRRMLSAFIPSFAKKVGMPAEKVHSMLTPRRNWEGLVEHLMEINGIEVP